MAPKLVKKPAAKVLAKPQAVDTDQESMTLDEKMDMIKQNKDVQAAPLTPGDWKKINQRFTQTAMATKPDAKKVWERIKDESRAGTKQANQRRVLEAFLLDPSCGDFFLEQAQTLSFGGSCSKESTWLSRKQLLDVYDESEAEEMLENGSLQYRANPKNDKRIQFRVEQEKASEFFKYDEKVNLRGSNNLSVSQHALASTKMRERVDNTAPEKALKMGLRDLLRQDKLAEEGTPKGKPSLKRKNKGSSILGLGQTGDDDDDSENHDGVQENPKDDLLKKAVACKKLENELKQALYEFKSSPYSSKSKLLEHTKKLEALEKMQTQVDPTKMSKMSASKLETLTKSATKALENAKQSVNELKKLRKLDTGTVAYSEGGKSKKSKR